MNTTTISTSSTNALPVHDIISFSTIDSKVSFRVSSIERIALEDAKNLIVIAFTDGDTRSYKFRAFADSKDTYDAIISLWRLAVQRMYAQTTQYVQYAPSYAPTTPTAPAVPWQPTHGPWSSNS